MASSEAYLQIFDFPAAVTAIGLLITAYMASSYRSKLYHAVQGFWIRQLPWIFGLLGINLVTLAFSVESSNLLYFGILILLQVLLLPKFFQLNFQSFLANLKKIYLGIIKNIDLAEKLLFIVCVPVFVVFLHCIGLINLNLIFSSKLVKSINLDFHIWLQYLSFLFLCAAPISYVYLSNQVPKGVYKGFNKENFHPVIGKALANDREANSFKPLVNVILENLDLIFDEALKHDCDYAHKIIDEILTDSDLIDYIVTGRIEFLQQYFDLVSKYNVEKHPTGEKIFERLFFNQQSYLYKHLKYEGMAKVANIYEIIYKNKYIVEHFQPFPDYKWDLEDLDRLKLLEVYEKAISFALKTLFENNIIHSRAMYFAFEQLKSIAWKIHFRNLSRDDSRVLFQINDLIARKIPACFKDYYTELTSISNPESLIRISESTFDYNILVFWAKSYLEFFDALSRITDSNFDFYFETIHSEIYLPLGSEVSSHKEYLRELFFIKLWDFIDKFNLNGLWGAVCKVHFNLVLFRKNEPSFLKDEYNKCTDFLYNKLRPKFLNNEKMQGEEGILMEEALLPSNIKFQADEQFLDGSQGAFYYYFKKQKGEEQPELIKRLD